MNQQEQATKHAAIFQDTINGTNDPTPWPVTMWATSGDTIWTAGTARTAGEDSVGMIYAPGETIAHRNTIAGDTTRATESFAIRPESGQSPMDAMLAGIEQWDHRHPDQWDTVTTPGEYRMTDPTTGRPLPMGWSDSLAVAASAAGRLDPDLMVFSWHQNQQGLFDAMTFKHLQYDDLSMQVTTISHSEDMRESFPAKTMSDGELLTQSRVYRDEYQFWREHDGGPVAHGMTGWATDMFMSGKNQSQKNEGRAVNLRFRPGTPVELFTGRGAERRTVQVDPQTLVQAIIDAQKRSRDAEETLDTASVELASKTVEESWPQISRMQGRFTEYRRAGTYKPAVALKWARRLVDRTAGGDEGRWTNRQRRQAARLLIQELAGAQEPMQDRGKTPTRPTTEQDAEATDTPRKTEPTKETEQGRDHDEAGSPAADPGAKAEPPETTRRDDPERRHTDLKSTLDRFHTKLRENLDGLNTATPAPGIDRNHGQRKTL